MPRLSHWLLACCLPLQALASGPDDRYLAVESLPATLSPAQLARLSWDHGQRMRLYASPAQQKRLEAMGFRFRTLPHPGDNPAAAQTAKSADWAGFPAYEDYVARMQDYAQRFPQLARLEEIGTSQQGRKLLAIKISRNPELDEAEPEVFYTSTMHGDETTGFALLLRLIDTLLENPDNDPRIEYLLDHLEIWINPLANPDGTYAGGNASVAGARRFLANNIDPNRNFPDPVDGNHPDGNAYAPETEAMMNFAAQRNFTLAANFHGGAEVFNYPWDNRVQRHPDDDWFQQTGRAWADSAQQNWPGSGSYFRDLNNGITNGYDWYPVSGGRQDWMNAVMGCFEATIELSAVKNPDPATLPDYWAANRDALLGYLEQALTAVRGRVVDSKYRPIADALIQLDDRDPSIAPVFSDASSGDFFRLTPGGVHSLRITAPGYAPLQVPKAESWNPERPAPVYILWPASDAKRQRLQKRPLH